MGNLGENCYGTIVIGTGPGGIWSLANSVASEIGDLASTVASLRLSW